MKYVLNHRVENEIISLARKHELEKVILFGSRARGTNHERSDIDLAVKGGDVTRFSLDVDDKVWTLLKFDVVDLGMEHSVGFLSEIEKDGVLLYEKV